MLAEFNNDIRNFRNIWCFWRLSCQGKNCFSFIFFVFRIKESSIGFIFDDWEINWDLKSVRVSRFVTEIGSVVLVYRSSYWNNTAKLLLLVMTVWLYSLFAYSSCTIKQFWHIWRWFMLNKQTLMSRIRRIRWNTLAWRILLAGLNTYGFLSKHDKIL